ncbi:MAG: hypothetical protein IBX41_07545 [Methanophagales archaeon]|nr:hypothetical protein [Methanophagales archaeon]
MSRKRLAIGVVLVSISVIGLLVFGIYQLRADNMDRALSIAERYLVSLDNPDLAIDELMEFELNYYVVYYEQSTGIGAFEMLIDKYTGRIFPEYGPNMMWNTKYGHAGMMGGWALPPTAEMPVTQDEALSIAQEYLDRFLPGTVAEDPHPFYGYYTIHVTRNGEIYGMLSVDGYDGVVWYHNWHGAFIQSREVHEE